MPSLHKIHNNVARHHKMMDRNICANLIRHDYIVTGRTKAKRAQPKIERFLGRALNELRKSENKDPQYLKSNIKALSFLQAPDREEIGTKVLSELSERYPERTHGFTRIIKLEPRLGEDKAPMSVLELVDSEYEIKFWYTAKVVARLELQGLGIDELTEINVNKLTQLRPDGENRFREAVETAKIEFFKYDPESGTVSSEEMKENLKLLPRDLSKHSDQVKPSLRASKKFKTIPRNIPEKKVELPKSPFLKSQ